MVASTIKDFFAQMGSHWTAPPTNFYAVTPNDYDDLPVATRYISWGVDGVIACHTVDDKPDAPARLLASGSLNVKTQQPLRLRKIFATGTTATGIVAWY